MGRKKQTKQEALLMLERIATMSNMVGGKGFRQYSFKKNGGAKNRKCTWVDRVTSRAYEGDGGIWNG